MKTPHKHAAVIKAWSHERIAAVLRVEISSTLTLVSASMEKV